MASSGNYNSKIQSMAEISLTRANRCLTGTRNVDRYITLEKEKVREIGRRSFALELLDRHNGDEVILKISSAY